MKTKPGIGQPREAVLTPQEQAEKFAQAQQTVKEQEKQVLLLLNQLNESILKLNAARAICQQPPVTISTLTNTFPSQALTNFYHDMAAAECKDIRLQEPYENK